jgi:hypothetical protein
MIKQGYHYRTLVEKHRPYCSNVDDDSSSRNAYGQIPDCYAASLRPSGRSQAAVRP